KRYALLRWTPPLSLRCAGHYAIVISALMHSSVACRAPRNQVLLEVFREWLRNSRWREEGAGQGIMADRVEYCFPRHPANHADFNLAGAGEAVPEGVLRCGHALRSAGKVSSQSVDDAF